MNLFKNSQFIKHFLIQLSLITLFWLCLFAVNRIVFYAFISHLINDVPFTILLSSLFHAIRLDMSMVGYFSSIPLLILFIYYLFPKQGLLKFINVFIAFLVIVYNLISVGEMGLYREWKAKMSMQALMHFSNPDEVFRTTSFDLMIYFVVFNVLLSGAFIYIFYKKVAFTKNIIPVDNILTSAKKLILFPILLLIIVAFSVINIRGGLQQIPIQSSDAYFTNNPLVNDASVNPFWNLIFNIIEYNNKFKENPYKDFPQADADKITRSLFAVQKDTTEIFLNNSKPNIVYILLESWSASCVEGFGGDNYAPFMSSLAKEGISFTKFYPGGYVSDQGIPAVLSGYPALSRMSVINVSEKSVKLPCISEDLKPLGYQSGFYFGGDLNYGNLRSYVYQKKFDIVKEEKDYSDLPKGKLGIHDNYMNKQFITEINQLKQPFLASWFTVSTHMPYDFEGTKKRLTPLENDFTNSMVFADSCLKVFFDYAKKQAWYKNTLFVLVADHSHGSHKNSDPFMAAYHQIPCVFYGDVIKNEFKGRKIDKVFSQLDITPSILKQMKLHNEAEKYVWSKNMFNPYSKNVAYYCSYGGAGMVSNKGWIGFNHQSPGLMYDEIKPKQESDSLTKYAKAFQQSVYEDYRTR
ncbi:MAG: hypothetical protein RLZZ175_1439 [Bacteroidota bacterium]|jgi:phosphoglycerol transferase MdoB-like AlkP superfamily enzyme